MRLKFKKKTRLGDEERQLVLQLVASLYADIEEAPRKPPSPDKPKPAALLQMRKGAAA